MSAGRGVFQPFIHEIDNRAQTLVLYGLPVVWSLCRVPCSVVHDGAPTDGIPHCTACFGDPDRETDALQRRPLRSTCFQQPEGGSE
jgi:hypothetical protein